MPNLRSSKIQGQSNFVNPGLFLFNAGVDVDVTPQLPLDQQHQLPVVRQRRSAADVYTFQQKIDDFIGIDLSTGIEYRPLLNNNVLFIAGVSSLVPGDGFRSALQQLARHRRFHGGGVCGFGVEVLGTAGPVDGQRYCMGRRSCYITTASNGILRDKAGELGNDTPSRRFG